MHECELRIWRQLCWICTSVCVWYIVYTLYRCVCDWGVANVVLSCSLSHSVQHTQLPPNSNATTMRPHTTVVAADLRKLTGGFCCCFYGVRSCFMSLNLLHTQIIFIPIIGNWNKTLNTLNWIRNTYWQLSHQCDIHEQTEE